jgi:hypothetical protein
VRGRGGYGEEGKGKVPRPGRSRNQRGMMDLKDLKDLKGLEATEPDHSVSHFLGSRLTHSVPGLCIRCAHPRTMVCQEQVASDHLRFVRVFGTPPQLRIDRIQGFQR